MNLTLSGTATNGSDYSSISTSQTFAINQSTRVVTVTPIDDTVVEPPETVVLSVVAGTGYTVGSPSSATVTITSDDGATSVSIVATDPDAAESPINTGQFTLTRTGSTAAALTVTLSRSGTATNGSDYSSISTSQTFAINQSTRVVTVTPIDDTVVEPPETVVLSVVAGTGYTVGTPSSATVTISSDDFVPCVPGWTTLCLVGNRFEVTLSAVNGGNPYVGKAIAYPSSTVAGWFWLFSSPLPEVSVKILDNGNGTYAVTYGASTDSATTLTVTDLAAARTQVYTKAAGGFCGASDTQAFLTVPSAEVSDDSFTDSISSLAAFTCVPNATTTCLLGGRFQVRVRIGASSYQQAIATTSQSGTYWFSSATQPEVYVNLVDGTPLNSKYWVFFGSLTNQAYALEVTDSVSGVTKTYSRTTSQPWCGGGDIQAF